MTRCLQLFQSGVVDGTPFGYAIQQEIRPGGGDVWVFKLWEGGKLVDKGQSCSRGLALAETKGRAEEIMKSRAKKCPTCGQEVKE